MKKKKRLLQQDSIRTQLTGLRKTICMKIHPDKRPFIPLAQAEIDNRNENTKGIWKDNHAVSKSTKINEQTILNHIVKFKGGDIRCCDITPGFIQELDDYLSNLRNRKGERINDNTKAAYMRSARSLLNRMGYDGETLFEGINTRNYQTDKRALSEEEIQKLNELARHPMPSDFLLKALLLFLFSFSANGMPFIDLAFLRWDMISHDTITYHRHKTGVKVEVPINDFMRNIMKIISRRDSEYVFGLLRSQDPGQAMAEYKCLLGRYNKALHLLGEQADLNMKLTSYVARHSWATITYLHNYSIAFISKALGHTNILTTEKYIQSITNKEFVRCSRDVARNINLQIDIDHWTQKEII